jgi:hypothetical protein
MDIAELKSNILDNVARIENESRLEKLYATTVELVQEEKNAAEFEKWDGTTTPYNLSPEQETELMLAYEESLDEANLLDYEGPQMFMEWSKQ